jgi:hypothetical protein
MQDTPSKKPSLADKGSRKLRLARASGCARNSGVVRPFQSFIMDVLYRPLGIGSDEIRLLQILPLKDGEALSFRLHHFPLNATPEFCAFSYTWSDTTGNKFRIHVDGHDFVVTENLANAL